MKSTRAIKKPPPKTVTNFSIHFIIILTVIYIFPRNNIYNLVKLADSPNITKRAFHWRPSGFRKRRAGPDSASTCWSTIMTAAGARAALPYHPGSATGRIPGSTRL